MILDNASFLRQHLFNQIQPWSPNALRRGGEALVAGVAARAAGLVAARAAGVEAPKILQDVGDGGPQLGGRPETKQHKRGPP